MKADESNEYFSIIRYELFPHIPEGAQSILDIGCGDGATIKELKDKGFPYVAGVEIMPEQVANARKVADFVLNIDLNLVGFRGKSYFVDTFDRQFDAIIMGDVLEHLPFPTVLLGELHDLLAEHGVIILSVPNSGWIDMVDKILNQSWARTQDGHFDATHMRFYCREDLRKLIEACGYEITKLESLRGEIDPPMYSEGMNVGFHEGQWQINNITEDHLEQLMTYQWLCVAKVKPANRQRPLVEPEVFAESVKKIITG